MHELRSVKLMDGNYCHSCRVMAILAHHDKKTQNINSCPSDKRTISGASQYNGQAVLIFLIGRAITPSSPCSSTPMYP